MITTLQIADYIEPQQEYRDHAIVERLQLTVDHSHIRIVSSVI